MHSNIIAAKKSSVRIRGCGLLTVFIQDCAVFSNITVAPGYQRALGRIQQVMDAMLCRFRRQAIIRIQKDEDMSEASAQSRVACRSKSLIRLMHVTYSWIKSCHVRGMVS